MEPTVILVVSVQTSAFEGVNIRGDGGIDQIARIADSNQ
jgi:hypothetical protein